MSRREKMNAAATATTTAGVKNADGKSGPSSTASAASAPPSPPPPSPPSAYAQYTAAVNAVDAATPAPARRRAAAATTDTKEKFADLKWMWSRELRPPNDWSRAHVESAVLGSARVQSAIEAITADSSNQGSSGGGGGGGSGPGATAWSRDDAMKAARGIFAEMYADINDTNVRASIYVMRKVWRTMYEKIRVNDAGIRMLHEYNNAKIPIVLLPMHKSHVDYLLLSYVCAAYNLFPPHIVAGNNLNMPLVGSILRHGGGLFIRRVFGDDDLYKSIFYEYIATLIQGGHILECFIEGTRSRQGKIKAPKIGFLSILVDLLINGRLGEKDIMLVPIAISYDKVIEGSSYVNEMLGAKKQKESLTQTINSLNHVIRLNFGSIDVSICQGISLREALGLHTNRSHLSATPFLSYTLQEQKRVITSLAHRISWEMNLKLVISATSIIATVLLTCLNRGISRKDIIKRAEELTRMITERGGSVAHIFSVESQAAIVDRALKVLGKLVSEQHSIVFGFRNITSLELSFYRNQLLHFFVSESLMCVAMAAEHQDVKQLTSASGRASSSSTGAASTPAHVSKSRLIDSVRFISQLLKYEFIYKPAPDLEDNVEATIDSLIQRGVLTAHNSSNNMHAAAATSINAAFSQPAANINMQGNTGMEGGGGEAHTSMETTCSTTASNNTTTTVVERKRKILPASAATPSSASSSSISCLSLSPTGVDTFLFLSMLTWPFIETYWVAIASLFVLLPDVIMESKKLSETASRRAEALFYSGDILFYEALNTESISMAYEWCVSRGILRVHQVGNTRMLQLTPEYQTSSEQQTAVNTPLPKQNVKNNEATAAANRRINTTTTPFASSSSSPSSSPPKQSLRSLVLHVGRFRKNRLLNTDSSRSLLDSFVADLSPSTPEPDASNNNLHAAAAFLTNKKTNIKARM